jgi:hypothetical protein
LTDGLNGHKAALLSANLVSRHKERFLPRHTKNAAGPFYVVNTECMTCGYPHALAPDLMEWERDSEGHECHCYFKRQPGSSQEIEQAVNAINGSCCGALAIPVRTPRSSNVFHDRQRVALLANLFWNNNSPLFSVDIPSIV